MEQISTFINNGLRSSIHSVTKHSQTYFVLGFQLSLPIDFIHSTPQTAMYETPTDYVFTLKQKLQETHQLRRELVDVKQECQKICHGRSRFGPSYKIAGEVLSFLPNGTKNSKQDFFSFYRGPYRIVEQIKDLYIQVEDKKTRKTIKVHYDRIKNMRNQKSPSRLSFKKRKNNN